MPYSPFIMLDEKSALPLYRQIYEAIRHAILSGNLRPTASLPASRLLCRELGVSRMTVVNAYDQLFAEGYLEAKLGAGTFVAAHLPEEFLQTSGSERREQRESSPARKVNFSDYGK